MKNRQNGLCVKIAITQYVFYIKFANLKNNDYLCIRIAKYGNNK